MKSILIGLALLAGAPALAQTTAQQPEKKECCCDKAAEKKMDCCDKMKGDHAPSSDAHAGHDMSGMSKQ